MASDDPSPPGHTELAARLARTCTLRGDFTLRSGRRADTYFDKYRFESDPALLRAVADLAAPLVPPGTELLAGLELGGVPVATALSLVTGLPTVFVRKVAKTYGTAKLAEGAEVTGRRLLVVEDVVTTGGQVAASTGDLRTLGATVDTALCIIDRSGGDHHLAAADLHLISVFTGAELDLG
ncbi:MAG: orotate phosphoribosyltransferase [Actinomycetota bacterium]|nr:orotate phosphoribosyltransferase [Actinomycetota bacterium]